MRKPISLVILTCFAAFICAPALAWALGVKGGGTALQNRNLAPRPPLTFASVWDQSFGKAFSDWTWDAIPLRDKALKSNHQFVVSVFHDSPSKDAFFGLEGWTWRRERVLQDIRAGGSKPADVMHALDRIEQAFSKAGVPLHIVISPSKPSIYSEFLPPVYRQEFKRIAGPAEKALIERAKRDSAIVDLWKPIREEKNRLLALPDSEFKRPEMRWLWRRNDDHWNVEAGRIQAREIVQAIEPAAWDESKAPTLTGEFEEQESELSRLYFKTDIMEPYQRLTPSPLVDVTYTRSNPKKTHQPTIVAESRPTPGHSPSSKKILILRDSFLSDHSGAPSCTRDAGVQTIAPFFSKSIFLHWDTLQKLKKELQPYIQDVDEVVVQVTQGSMYYLVKRTVDLNELAQMVKAGRAPPPSSNPLIGPQLPSGSGEPR